MSDTACEVCGHGWSEGSHFNCTVPMSDDRPVSPEELSPFLPRAADRLYHECDRAIRAGRIDARSGIGDAALDYHDIRWPKGDHAAPSTPAGPSPEPWTDPALFPHLNHPAPREEAVEAAAKAIAEWHGTTWPTSADYYRRQAHAALEAALSAARPSSPTPEETRLAPRLHVICADCEGWDATHVSCPHGCGVALKAPFVATPGDDATTKEGR